MDDEEKVPTVPKGPRRVKLGSAHVISKSELYRGRQSGQDEGRDRDVSFPTPFKVSIGERIGNGFVKEYEERERFGQGEKPRKPRRDRSKKKGRVSRKETKQSVGLVTHCGPSLTPFDTEAYSISVIGPCELPPRQPRIPEIPAGVSESSVPAPRKPRVVYPEGGRYGDQPYAVLEDGAIARMERIGNEWVYYEVQRDGRDGQPFVRRKDGREAYVNVVNGKIMRGWELLVELTLAAVDAYAPLIGAMRVLDESSEAAVEIEPSQITDQRGA